MKGPWSRFATLGELSPYVYASCTASCTSSPEHLHPPFPLQPLPLLLGLPSFSGPRRESCWSLRHERKESFLARWMACPPGLNGPSKISCGLMLCLGRCSTSGVLQTGCIQYIRFIHSDARPRCRRCKNGMSISSQDHPPLDADIDIYNNKYIYQYQQRLPLQDGVCQSYKAVKATVSHLGHPHALQSRCSRAQPRCRCPVVLVDWTSL